jgi:hypothetical protein
MFYICILCSTGSGPAAYCVSVACNGVCFTSSTVECVIYVFCNILVYSNGFLSWLVYLFYTDSFVIFCVGPRVSVFLWMRLSVRGEFALLRTCTDFVLILKVATNCTDFVLILKVATNCTDFVLILKVATSCTDFVLILKVATSCTNY